MLTFVFSQQQLTGMAYMTTPENWRRIAHIISDEIYKRITGESGYFDTRIVYISESGSATQRIKRLAIMDQDGKNHRKNGAVNKELRELHFFFPPDFESEPG